MYDRLCVNCVACTAYVLFVVTNKIIWCSYLFHFARYLRLLLQPLSR